MSQKIVQKFHFSTYFVREYFEQFSYSLEILSKNSKIKLDLVPNVDNSLMKLLSGGEQHQSQLMTNHRGFDLTNALAQQIVQMDSGQEVSFKLRFHFGFRFRRQKLHSMNFDRD